MFPLWHNLYAAHKTTVRSRMPRSPLALALLWDYQDGYLAGIPVWLQHAVFGGPARPATRIGLWRRWLETGHDQD